MYVCACAYIDLYTHKWTCIYMDLYIFVSLYLLDIIIMRYILFSQQNIVQQGKINCYALLQLIQLFY